eukprot:gene44064-54755_t
MKIGDKGFSGVVKEKTVARAEFNAAVDAGIKSSVLEKVSDGAYSVDVGPIEPSESVEIELRYLARVAVQPDGTYRFVLPTNIAPKYTSPHTTNQKDIDYAANMNSIPYVSQPPYAFEVDIAWHSGSALQEIVSPTNTIRTEVFNATSVRVHCTTAPENGDFTLSVRTAQTTAAYTYEKEDGTTFVYVHNQIPAEEVSAQAGKKITIVLDRSGSMYGNTIEHAKRAIDSFLDQLPESAFILLNVVSFGSHFDGLFSHSVPATAENI